MSKLQSLCIGFTPFRPEALSLAKKMMQKYEAVFLEEPQTPGFEEMLRCKLSIEEYLALTDFEFPQYAYNFCLIAQELFRQGKSILQIDPYMDQLISIQEFFAAEGRPDQITSGTLTRQVYDSEHQWTKKLLKFYKASGSKEFERIVSSVKEFARVDAQKGWLRNKMRSEKISNYFQNYRSIYVETGYIHIALMSQLLSLLPAGVQFYPAYLMEPVIRSLIGKKQLLGPGDWLTLIYTFRPVYDAPKADLLAAQSLIYNKVVQKEEINNDQGDYPHARNEIEAIDLATSLSFEQCRELFYLLKPLSTAKAREYARDWRIRRLS